MRRLLAMAVSAALAVVVLPNHAMADPGSEFPDDTEPPTITFTRPAGSIDGWHSATVNVTIRVADRSGVAEAKYTLSGATTGSGDVNRANGTTLTISNSGSTRITIDAEDTIGNQAQHIEAVGVDREAPTITFSDGVFDQAVYVRNQVVPFSYSCSDHQVGVATCESATPNGSNLNTATTGSRQVSATSRDRLGNVRTRTASYQVVEPYLAQTHPLGVTGTPRLGHVLTVTPPRFTPEPTSITYRWRRNGVDIPGATDQSYTPVVADVTQNISVVATARRQHFNDATSMVGAGVIQEGRFVIDGDPSIDGDARVGSELHLGHGEIYPAPQTKRFQWLRNGVPIPGATSEAYRLVAADAGTQISATVTASSAGYFSATYTSGVTPLVQGDGGLMSSGSTSITGTRRVGAVLTARAPTYAPAAALRYQWTRNGKAIAGATGRTYRLAEADRGRTIQVRVTATASGHAPVSTTAAAGSIAKANASVKASVKARGKRKARVTVTVSVPGLKPTGKVMIKRGKKVLAKNKTIKNGKVVINLKKLLRGRTTLTVGYQGSNGVNAKVVKTKRVKIR